MDGGSTTLTNVTISGNNAGNDSAAIFTSGQVKLVNSTIAGNSSPNPPSIYVNNGTVTFRSTIIDQRDNACGAAFTSPAPFVSEGYNIDRGASCGLAMKTTSWCGYPPQTIGDQQNVDPQLSPLADNGGLTMTHALSQSSPALDRVPPSYAPPTDQRGVRRPQFPACTQPPCNYASCSTWDDAGAVELVRKGQVIVIHRLRPRPVNVLTDKLVLQIEGQGFRPNATIYWNNTPLPTEVRDPTHIEAAVTAELFPRCGIYSILAKNPDAESSAPMSVEVDGCAD